MDYIQAGWAPLNGQLDKGGIGTVAEITQQINCYSIEGFVPFEVKCPHKICKFHTLGQNFNKIQYLFTNRIIHIIYTNTYSNC